MTSVVVVGGGVAGLVSAWELTRAGVAVTLLEATPDLGGCVARHRVGDLDLDAGAESFAVAGGTVAELARDLGLTDRLIAPNPVGAWVVHERGAAPLPVGGLLGIPARPLRRDSRAVLGWVGAARAGVDALLPARVGSGATTVAGLVGARMGGRVVRRLVEPVAGGVYSTDPNRLELAAVAPRLQPLLAETGSLAGAVRVLRPAARPGAGVLGLDGGVFELVRALELAGTGLGLRIRRDTPALAVQHGDDGVAVTTASGRLDADALVLATDRPDLLPGADLPRPVAADVLLVTLVVHAPALTAAPRGTGVLVSATVRDVGAKALTHATAKWSWLADQAGPGVHVLRLSYGRGDGLPPGDIDADQALRDASRLLGVTLETSGVRAVATRRWRSPLPAATPGQAAATARARASLPDRIAVTGAWVAGTGLAAVVADARRTATALVGAARGWAG